MVNGGLSESCLVGLCGEWGGGEGESLVYIDVQLNLPLRLHL